MDLAVIVVLSTAVGLSLGLLGGGGSILTVPILLFAANMGAKEAIATSLVVVAATSVAALIPHARAGHVKWRIGAVFGAAAMVGAFGGGLVAQYIPGWILLLAFGATMLITAVAMLRSREPEACSERTHLPVGLIAIEGVAVGAFTGMVGAGGGFAVVPALALLGGLAMRDAVGTSLFVIALKSAAGFAGYASHVQVDYRLAAIVTAAAVAGAFGGAALSRAIPPRALRTAFGWFVGVMAVYVIAKQLPTAVTDASWFQAAFVTRWPWWIGGAAIGSFVLVFLRFEHKLLGVSTGYADLCSLPHERSARSSWRIPFVGGIVLGGLAAGLIGGNSPSLAFGAFDALWGASLAVKIPVLLTAGVLIGFGTRTAGGCTSGHGIVGVAQGARSSLIATATFMAAGFAMTHLLLVLS